MAPAFDWVPPYRSRSTDRQAVCPFCGATYQESVHACDVCGGCPVVGPENRAVFENVHPMCGPGCDVHPREIDPSHRGDSGRIEAVGAAVVSRFPASRECLAEEAVRRSKSLVRRTFGSGLYAVL